jgi:hypothetical protein
MEKSILRILAATPSPLPCPDYPGIMKYNPRHKGGEVQKVFFFRCFTLSLLGLSSLHLKWRPKGATQTQLKLLRLGRSGLPRDCRSDVVSRCH